MDSMFDDCSWEQVYGIMRCSTKFEIRTDSDDEQIELEYFDY